MHYSDVKFISGFGLKVLGNAGIEKEFDFINANNGRRVAKQK